MTVASITWTRFLDRSASSARELRHEWRELVEHLQHAGPYSAKSLCPWIKLARFGSVRSGKGALRHDGNLLEITGVEGDYDGEQMQPEEAVRLLESHHLRALVYTSPSHRPESPRWRVLAPLAATYPPAARTALLARVNGALGGVLTSESFTLSQSYYYGRVAGQTDYRVLVTFDDPDEGLCVDEADELDGIAVAKAPREHLAEGQGVMSAVAAKVEQLGRRLRTGDGRRELLKSYIGDKSNRGLSEDEIRTLVDDVVSRFFDSSDPVDWSNINGLISDIAGADAAERAKVAATVGGFISTLEARQPEKAPAIPFLTLDQLQAASESIAWTVKHIVPAESIGVLFGGSGTFKSFIALDFALHVAHGMPWLGKKTKKGAVLFIAAEGGAGLWRRIQAWHQARGILPTGIEFYVVPVALALAKDASKVVEAANTVGVAPSVVIVDTMSQTFDGEENSANEVAAYLRELGNNFRALWRASVVVVHHSGHQATERPRGSSAIRSNVDFMFGVFRDEKEMLATMECHKQKDGELFQDVPFALSSERLGTDEDGEAITSLSASHLVNADALVAAHRQEAASGRGGRNQALLALVQNGMAEKELRKAFYEDLGTNDPEARKKAFYRARDWAVSNGYFEIAQGRILVLREF